MTRRTRLYVRQSLAYRQGQSSDASWSVGYWEKKNLDPDRDFRVFTTKPTKQEAEAAAAEIAQQKKHLYIWD